MKRIKYQLYETKCKRCGKPLMTSTRSLWGSDEGHSKYSGICSSCLTNTENEDMVRFIKEGILRAINT